MKKLSILLFVLLSFVPAIVSAAPFAYITSFVDNTVSVIDTATDTVVATIPVGSGPQGLAVNPSGTKGYVTGLPLSVIDTATNTVVATTQIGSNRVAVHPDGTKVYLALGTDAFAVVDTETNTVITTKTTRPAGSPSEFNRDIAISPAGTKLYLLSVRDLGPSLLYIISTETNEVLSRLILEGSVHSMAVDKQGSRLYIAAGPLFVLDAETGAMLVKIQMQGAWGVAVHPDGAKVYVTNGVVDSVSVIDTITNTVVASIPVGLIPNGVDTTPDGTKVYVANELSNTVSVIDTSTNTVNKTIAVGRAPISFGRFIGPKPMPAPTSQTVIPYEPVVKPFFDPEPAKANPFATGDITGGTLSLKIGLSMFAGPVDVYLGIHAASVSPEVLIVQPDNSLLPISQSFISWKTNTGGPIEASLYGDIPVSLLPSGTYTLYVAVTPPGRFDVYYLWYTIFVIP